MDNTENTLNNPQTVPSEMITDEMRAAGVDEDTPLKTREEMVVELGEEEVARIEAEAKTVTEAALEDGPIEDPAEEAPKEPEAPVEEEKTLDQQVAEKLVPYVEGKLFEGKRLIAAEWSGEALIVRDENEVKYTLTGTELEKFLSY